MGDTAKNLIPTGYTIFHPNGVIGSGTIDWPHDPGYEAIKRLVTPLLGGTFLERVTVWLTADYRPGNDGRYADMFVDDEGAVKQLPRNEAATTIYRCNWLTQHPKTEPESMPAIHGVAVLFDRRVWY